MVSVYWTANGELRGSNQIIEISASPTPHIANSAMMSTLTVYCQWADEAVRKRTGHPPLYTEAFWSDEQKNRKESKRERDVGWTTCMYPILSI